MTAQALTDFEQQWQALVQDGEATPEKVDRLTGFLGEHLMDHPASILVFVNDVRALADRLDYASGRSYAVGLKGYSLYLLSNHEAALPALREALAQAETLNDARLEALMLGGLASVQMSLGNYEQALTFGLRALRRQRQLDDTEAEGWCLHGIGNGYYELRDYAKALDFLEQALALFERIDFPIGIARCLTSIGSVYRSQGEYEKALPYHEKSLGLFEAAGNRLGEARALDDLGLLYQHLGDLERAEALHKKSLAIREGVGNRQAQSTSLINLGRLYLARDDADEALKVLHRALRIAKDIKAKPRIYQSHLALSQAYEQKGELDAALTHQKAYHHVKEQVLGEEKTATIKNIQIGFEVEKSEKEAEIAQLRNVELKDKNEQLERLLQELKAAQAQLVQSEKMASLGALTAGIAHEIKNPLNFVNNFAQLSKELAEELREALGALGDALDAEARQELDELVGDLQFNAEKIEEHGRRADGIVRAMLQHSRGKPGERHPADLNELIAEYVNLAYHGMRARQTDFNVTLDRHFDEAVGRVEVVPQELGRVLINLLNNAFYAVHERAQQDAEGYRPTVRVQTRRVEDHVEIQVEDNGPGIPEAVRAKIFEPFFTTKPTGQGTGLGLSLSYDIVTRGHSGAMTVESEPGAGTTFVVTLPSLSTG